MRTRRGVEIKLRFVVLSFSSNVYAAWLRYSTFCMRLALSYIYQAIHMKTKRTKASVVEAHFRTSFCSKTSTRFCTECGLALRWIWTIAMDRIHLRGKNGGRVPRWYNAALTHTKWMGNPSSPTLSSICENRRACFCQTSPVMHVWGILVPIGTVFKRSNRPRG